LAKHKKANKVLRAAKPPAQFGILEEPPQSSGKILCTHTPTHPQYSITSMKTPLKRLESALATLSSKAHQKEILRGIRRGRGFPRGLGFGASQKMMSSPCWRHYYLISGYL